MDISFEIRDKWGNQLKVALSYYDAEILHAFTSDAYVLTLTFYDVTLVREGGVGYVGYKMLSTVSGILFRFLEDNEDAVLCFYCDSATDVNRKRREIPPQEYRSALFSRMFEEYVLSHNISEYVNHCVVVEDTDNSWNSQYAHFICRKCHEIAVRSIGKLLLEK